MDKVAFVVQRCGREVNGGAEALCLIITQRMSAHWHTEILTTCALDYLDWANHYPPGEEVIEGTLVRRFPVALPRDIEAFNQLSSQLYSRSATTSLDEQEAWMRAQGPWSPALFAFIESHANDYDAFIFFGYLYAQTWFGLPKVADKAILAPLAHDEWTIYLNMWDHFFSLPRAFIFSTIEERDFLRKRFPSARLEGPVVGVAVDRPADIDPLRFRRNFGIDQGFLLYVGRIDPSKGCDELFDFFLRHRIAGHGPEKLVLLGKPVMPVPDHPDFIALGFVSEQTKWDALAACDVLVMPSPHESLSMVLLEAWSVGKPVIVNGRCEVLVGQCQRANGGVWYENFEEFSQSLICLQEGRHPGTLGRQGWRFVRSHYTWPTIEQHYRDVLTLILSAKDQAIDNVSIGCDPDQLKQLSLPKQPDGSWKPTIHTRKQRLLFDHVPKTAGQSLANVFASLMGESGEMASVSNPHHVLPLKGTRKLLAGHIWFYPGELLNPDWYYATIVRKPEDRFLSQYFFNKSNDIAPGTENDSQVLAARSLTLQQYLDYSVPEIIHSYTNIQAIHFAQRMCDDPYKLTDDQLYNLACASLMEYDCIGVYEDLLGFVNIICRDFGFSPITSLPHLNITAQPRNERDITDDVLARLRKANGVDTQLYYWVRERFAQNKSNQDGPTSVRLPFTSLADNLSLSAPCIATNSAAMSDPDNPIEFGTREIIIESANCLGKMSGLPAMRSGEPCLIRLECRATIAVADLTIGIAIHNRLGELMYGTNSKLMDHAIAIEQPRHFTVEFVFDMNLGIGEYFVTANLHKGLSHLDGCYHWLEQAAKFAVVGTQGKHFEGAVRLTPRLSISIHGSSSSAASG